MGKKGVPEWMNSSLWSYSPPSSASGAAAASNAGDRLIRSAPMPEPDPPPLKPPEATLIPEYPLPLPTPPPNAPKPDTAASGDGSDACSSSASPEISGFSPQEMSRQSQLLAEISRKDIDVDELRRLASQGIPDDAGIRPAVWKLLLCYLPSNREQWEQELDKKRNQYEAFKEEFLVNPSEITRKLDGSNSARHEGHSCEGSGLLYRSELTRGEHPLSLGKTSLWNQFFQDNEIIEQIDRDVMRTHPDMHFFSGDTAFAKSNQESLRHILIIFAKLNPGIRYVQGMNEVLAPLYYVYRNDSDANNAASAEPDAFFCFVELLSGFRDNFCQKLDNSVVGIRSTITKLSQLLKKHDGELWRHLEITTKV